RSRSVRPPPPTPNHQAPGSRCMRRLCRRPSVQKSPSGGCYHCGTCDHGHMIIDGFVHQLPDVDPEETQEWLDSLSAVVDAQGKTRARFLMSKLLERARELQVGHPATVSTPYVNTIPPEEEPSFPGDEHVER